MLALDPGLRQARIRDALSNRIAQLELKAPRLELVAEDVVQRVAERTLRGANRHGESTRRVVNGPCASDTRQAVVDDGVDVGQPLVFGELHRDVGLIHFPMELREVGPVVERILDGGIEIHGTRRERRLFRGHEMGRPEIRLLTDSG